MGSAKWSAQSSWYVDPANGSDEDTGGIGHPLKTRGEFYRRMDGVTLPAVCNVTYAGSLASGDDFQSDVFGSVGLSRYVNHVGVPAALFTGTITGYVSAVPASNQVTTVTISSIPTSWTASGLVNKTIEYTDGAGNYVRAIVVADLGSKTAWVSPPINQSSQTTDFANGTSVTVWSLPNVRVPTIRSYNLYSYLDATWWNHHWGATILTNCTGQARAWSGILSLINCCNVTSPVPTEPLITLGAQVHVSGGYLGVVASGGYVNFKNHSTVYRLQTEGGGVISTSGNNGTFANIEVNGIQTATACVIDAISIQGGRYNFGGYVYGASQFANLIRFRGQGSTARFAHVPTVTTATSIAFDIAGSTGLLSSLTSGTVSDVNGNAAYGPTA